MHYLQQVYEIMQSARGLGCRVLDDGTRLIGRVPHVGSQAWLHLLFPPMSDPDIAEVENEIGIPFPEALIDFYSLANGLSLFSDSLSIYGRRDNYQRTGDSVWQPFNIVTSNTIERLSDAKPSYLFIGGYPSRKGFYLYIDTRELCVYRCTRQSSKPLAKWQSFEEMLVAEANRLKLFFDSQGRRVNPNQQIV
jgi:hypothetical protein